MDDSEMAETGTGLYDGFEGYRTATDAEYHCLLTSGLVIPDTNVFLNLYRYNEQTRSDLLTVLSGLGKRLWVPRQVMEEFWRNREGVLRDPRDTEKTATELMGQREKAVITFRRWANRVGLPPQRGDHLIKVLTGAFDGKHSGPPAGVLVNDVFALAEVTFAARAGVFVPAGAGCGDDGWRVRGRA